MAVVSPQCRVKAAEIEKLVNLAKQVIGGNVIIKVKVVKHWFWCCLTTHHRSVLPNNNSQIRNHAHSNNATDFFNKIGPKPTSSSLRQTSASGATPDLTLEDADFR